jgi:hypothetical protein
MSKVERSKVKEDSVTVRTMSNSSRPASSMANLVARTPPQTNFLGLRGCFNRSEK